MFSVGSGRRVHFLLLQDYYVKLPSFAVYGGREHKTMIFSVFLFVNLGAVR